MVISFMDFLRRPDRRAKTREGSGERRPRRSKIRRQQPASRAGATAIWGGEPLEPKQLLTVNLLAPMEDRSLAATAGSAVEILLADRFALPDVAGTVVKVQTNAPQSTPPFFFELFDTAAAAPVRTTPVTAANFLAYVDDGSFDSSIVHRSVPGFVIQGGGFKAPLAGSGPAAIPSKGSVVDEIGNPNQRGTLAMAKLAPATGGPLANSGTSQWFVNLADNTELDQDFAVFGRVLGNGIAVMDALASVPVYDASEYFSNGALTDLPLWDIPASGVIQPQNFVTLTDAGRVPTGELLTYTVSSANPALVRAAMVGDRLVVSRQGLQAGTTTVTVRASAAFDPSDFVEDSFEVTLQAVPQTPDVTIEDAGQVTLERDWTGRLLANGQGVTLSGAAVNYHQLVTSGWTAVAAEAVGGVNTIVLRNNASGHLHFWRFNATWARTAADGWVAPETAAFYATETTFGTDFDGDGLVGLTLTPIESAGSVTLARDQRGGLRANGAVISRSGSPLNYEALVASGWTPVAADVDGERNTLVLEHSGGALFFWRLDASWRQLSGDNWTPAGSDAYFAAEVTFETDFNRDGVIGLGLTELESAGGVTLTYDAAGNIRANGIQIKNKAGSPVNYQATVRGGWTPVAADVEGGRNTLVLGHSGGALFFWRLDASWRQLSGENWTPAGSDAYFTAEVNFDTDFNRDGVVGLGLTELESTGGVTLAYDAAGNLRANGIQIKNKAGSPVNYQATVRGGWTPVAADVDGGRNSLVLEHSGGALFFWRLDASWKQLSGENWTPAGTPGYFAAEVSFDTDFNGDGVIGRGLTVIESAGSVTLAYDAAGNLWANDTQISFNDAPVLMPAIVRSGWTPVAADVDGGANTLVLKHSSGPLYFWRMDASWRQTSGDSWTPFGTAAFADAERRFGLDFNGDGLVPIEWAGSVTLAFDTAGNLRANGTQISYNGAPIKHVTDPNAVWRYMAADVESGKNTLVLRNNSGAIYYWRMDANWRQTGGDSWTPAGTAKFASAETTFGVDFNGDRRIGA